MPGRNKGFDPLSSLFEAPEPSIAGEEAETEAAVPVEPEGLGRQLEFTDPTFKSPPSVPSPAVEPVDPAPSDEEKRALATQLAQDAAARAAQAAGPTDAEKRALAAKLAQEAAARAAQAGPTEAEKRALATQLAQEAAARAAQAGPTDAEKRALATKLAQEAAARAAQAGPTDAEKRALATKLAQEAAARAAQAGPTDAEKRALAAKLAQQVAARAPAPKPAPASRLDSLASRARRPRSALEAARAAAAAEASRKKAEPARPARSSAKKTLSSPTTAPAAPVAPKGASAVIVGAFPRTQVDVLAIKPAGQTDVLRSLWTAHRARFLAESSLVEAGGATAVLGAIERGSTLAAAHVRIAGTEAAAWVDLGQSSVLAVFPEPGVYLAGTG